ncbi:MAG: hypothetical protein ACYDDU_14780, partial [Dermatophilaceae bacterium]
HRTRNPLPSDHRDRTTTSSRPQKAQPQTATKNTGHLGADDPLLFGSRLNAQYDIARTAHGLSDVELAELARGSVTGSRAPDSTRRQMFAGIDEWLAS